MHCPDSLLDRGPLRFQHVHDRRPDQCLDIRAGRIVRAELRPLLRAQRLFEQGPEDRRLDVAPVLSRRLVQMVDVDAAELECAR